jgi:hypothetical protein
MTDRAASLPQSGLAQHLIPDRHNKPRPDYVTVRFQRPSTQIVESPRNVGYRGKTGKHILVLRITALDPLRTLAAAKYRNAIGSAGLDVGCLAQAVTELDRAHKPISRLGSVVQISHQSPFDPIA